jgi:AcrR family transcriptional regulator
MRADARRNRERVLTEARQMMKEDGVDVSLREVARRAEVGIGTLYRHFPTREALIRAALLEGIENLARWAEDSADAEDPGERLVAWVRSFALGAARYRGLPDHMLSAAMEPSSNFYRVCQTLNEPGEKLLARAQATGEIRADVSIDDVFAAVNAVGWVAQTGDGNRATTLLELVLDGLRTRTA